MLCCSCDEEDWEREGASWERCEVKVDMSTCRRWGAAVVGLMLCSTSYWDAILLVVCLGGLMAVAMAWVVRCYGRVSWRGSMVQGMELRKHTR